MLNQRIAELDAAIAQSRGGVATLWEYKSSLSELAIRISWPGKSENIHLVCNGCVRIEASTCWGNVNFAYELLESGDCRLVDKAALFSLICGQIRVLRNVEPMFVEAGREERGQGRSGSETN